MIEKIKKYLRWLSYKETTRSMLREGHNLSEMLTFEQVESLRGHIHSYNLKREPNDPNINPEYKSFQSEMYVCDNPLCNNMAPKSMFR